ncbi:MAG: hypothetical protein HC841_00120 [Verrucomicrobiae bacterium]|nr:hypothetical protein [Verrucomicrobiae bacterium]
MADVNSYVIPGLNATTKRTLEDGGVSVSLTHAELRMIGRMPADQQDAAALAQLQDKLARKVAKESPNEPGIIPAYPLEQLDGKWTERKDKQHIGAKLNGPGLGRRGTVVNRKKFNALKALFADAAQVAQVEAILATSKE